MPIRFSYPVRSLSVKSCLQYRSIQQNGIDTWGNRRWSSRRSRVGDSGSLLRGGALRLLVDPIELGGLPGLHLAVLEPESDFLLGILDAVAAVADVAADVLGESV
jgi:hypothetical protein